MKLYKSYMFRGKDPSIDELRTIVEDAYGAKVAGKHLADMERNGGPSTAAMRGWFFGATKRPNNATLEAAGRSLGYMRKWTKMKKGDE